MRYCLWAPECVETPLISGGDIHGLTAETEKTQRPDICFNFGSKNNTPSIPIYIIPSLKMIPSYLPPYLPYIITYTIIIVTSLVFHTSAETTNNDRVSSIEDKCDMLAFTRTNSQPFSSNQVCSTPPDDNTLIN